MLTQTEKKADTNHSKNMLGPEEIRDMLDSINKTLDNVLVYLSAQQQEERSHIFKQGKDQLLTLKPENLKEIRRPSVIEVVSSVYDYLVRLESELKQINNERLDGTSFPVTPVEQLRVYCNEVLGLGAIEAEPNFTLDFTTARSKTNEKEKTQPSQSFLYQFARVITENKKAVATTCFATGVAIATAAVNKYYSST